MKEEKNQVKHFCQTTNDLKDKQQQQQATTIKTFYMEN